MTYASYAGNLGPLAYYTNSVGDTNYMARMQGIFAYIGGLLRRRPAERPADPVGRDHRRNQQHLPLRRARPCPNLHHRHARRRTVFGANWWTSGDYGDTTRRSFYPNYFQTNEDGYKLPDTFRGATTSR